MYAILIEQITKEQLDSILSFLKLEIESSYWSVVGDYSEDGEAKGEEEDGHGDQEMEEIRPSPLPPSTPIQHRPDLQKLDVALRCLHLLLQNIPGMFRCALFN